MHVFRGRGATALTVAVAAAAVAVASGDFCLYGQHSCDIHATCTLDSTKPTGYACTCKPDYIWDVATNKCVYKLCRDAQYALQNGDFSLPDISKYPYNAGEKGMRILKKNEVPKWKSTEDDIEIWRSGFFETPAHLSGMPQFAEIQANKRSALFQDIVSVPGTKLQFEFLHRGRGGLDTLAVVIGPNYPAVPALLPTCEGYIIGTKTSYTVFETNKEWKRYTVGPYTVPAGQTTTRVMFCAKAQATQGCDSCGNFIDEVQLKPPECFVDPCTTGGHNCDPNAQCIHGTGDAYTCTCNTGYVGNGFQCYNPDACKGSVYDMAIMMDMTKKVTALGTDAIWKNERRFVEEFMGQPMFTLGADLSHASLLYYGKQSAGPVVSVPMTSPPASNHTAFLNRLTNIPCTGTTLNAGLKRGDIVAATNEILSSPREVPKFILLITGGMATTVSTDIAAIKAEADAARAKGISVIGIPVGGSDAGNLAKYAITTPGMTIPASSWTTLSNVINDVLQRACERVPRHGGWGDWSYGECSKACGPALRPKNRLCNKPYPNVYGALCSTSSDPNGTHTFVAVGGINTLQHASSDPCEITPCPVNCVQTQWSPWSQCQAACNRQSATSTGTQSRTCTNDVEGAHGGTVCGPTEERRTCNKDDCPVDCAVSDWVAWANCDASNQCNASNPSGMATGLESRSRVVMIQPNGKGDSKSCPPLLEKQSCNFTTCPVDCQYTDWTPWPFAACTFKCDYLTATISYNQVATRSVKVPSKNNGKACSEPLTDTLTCTKTDCPVHCRVNDWTAWTPCMAENNCPADRSSPNATAIQERTRSQVSGTGINGGNACPPLSEQYTCSTDKCPVDCVQATWAEWGTCVATCKDNNSTANGIMARSRVTTREPMNGGKACSVSTENGACSIACPVNCTVSQWSDWSCDAQSKCNRRNVTADGTQTRTRVVMPNPEGIFGAYNNGSKCLGLIDTKLCNYNTCPIDCVMNEWSPWTCNATSNCKAQNMNGVVDVVGGTKTRTRTVAVPAEHGGTSCPTDLAQEDKCSTGSDSVPFCPSDCILSAWSDWSDWLAPCGDTIHTRTRKVTQNAAHGGVNCAQADLDTLWGKEDRIDPPLCKCDPNASESEQLMWCCEKHLTLWSDWSVLEAAFDSKCRDANSSSSKAYVDIPRSRSREFKCAYASSPLCDETDPAAHEQVIQENCPAFEESETVTNHPCKLNCILGEVVTGNCLYKCADPSDPDATASVSGQQLLTRPVLRPALNGGQVCDEHEVSHNENCTYDNCPISCLWADWGDYDTCTVTCGGGTQTRARKEARPASNNGAVCPADQSTETRPCNTDNCPVPCLLSQWSPWVCDAVTHCTPDSTNTTGTNVSTRYVITEAKFNGTCEEGRLQESPCTFDECPVECQTSDWSEWVCSVSQSDCTTNGTEEGVQTRTREVTRPAQFTPDRCTETKQEKPCDVKCDVDCKLIDWADWSTVACSTTCGNGTKTRTTTVVVEWQNNGATCGALVQEKACEMTSGCPVPCAVSDWSAWVGEATCDGTKPTATATHTRTREITSDPKNGGTPCPALHGSELFSIACIVDCTATPWSQWSDCDTKCGEGSQRRYRTIEQPAHHNGSTAACDPLDDTKTCTATECPVDCVIGEWAEWSACVATCDGVNARLQGTQTRDRNATTKPEYGGEPCPALLENAVCFRDCAVDCVVSDWAEWSVCVCGLQSNRTRNRYVTTASANVGAQCPDLNTTETCTQETCTAPIVVKPADKTPVIAGTAVGAAAAAALAGLGVLFWARKTNMASLATIRALEQDALFNQTAGSTNPLYQDAVQTSENPLYGV